MKIRSCLWKKTGIYIILNIYNYKKYVGSSKDIYHRLHKHKSQLKRNTHSNPYIQNVWNNNEESFRCFLIEECDESFLLEREQHWITKINPEYNLAKIIHPRAIFSEETKKKISERSKQLWKEGRYKKVYKKVKVYKLIEEYVGEFESLLSASNKLDVKYRSIQQSLSGNHKKHNREHQYIFYYSK